MLLATCYLLLSPSASASASSSSSGGHRPLLIGIAREELRMMAAGRADEYYTGPRGAPHGLLLAVVLGLVVAGPLFIGDGGEAATAAVAELLSPVGLLLLPVALVLLIRILSSDRAAAALAFGGSPDAVHRVGGSPVGVALALLLILAMLYYKTSLLAGGGGDDE